MLSSLRIWQWRTVVVCTVVLLATLAAATPATAASYWTFHKSYISSGKCLDAGWDLVNSGRYRSFLCLPVALLRYDLLVTNR